MSQPVVYFLQCHHSPLAVANIFNGVYSADDIIIIHVDKKSDKGLSDFVRILSETYTNVHVLSSIDISWGGYSQSFVLFLAIDFALEISQCWSHFFVLSEQHLSLYPSKYIAESLCEGESWVMYNKFSELPVLGQDDVRHRFSARYRELPGVGPFIFERKSQPTEFYEKLYHASNWFILAKNACLRLSVVKHKETLIEPFKDCLQSDEMLVPTLLLNQEFGANLRVVRRTATYVAYPHLSGTNDLTFNEKTFYDALSEGYLFIRKQPSVLSKDIKQFVEARSAVNVNNLLDNNYITKDKSKYFKHYYDSNSSVLRLVDIIKGQYPQIMVNYVDKEKWNYVPEVYVQLYMKNWGHGIKISIISQNHRNFKILLSWNREAPASFDQIDIGGYNTYLIKARVHGLAHHREIFLADLPDSGFFEINEGELTSLYKTVSHVINEAVKFAALL